MGTVMAWGAESRIFSSLNKTLETFFEKLKIGAGRRCDKILSSHLYCPGQNDVHAG